VGEPWFREPAHPGADKICVARAPALVRQLRPLVVQIPQALPDLYVIA
jgi:hypothetical protein